MNPFSKFLKQTCNKAVTTNFKLIAILECETEKSAPYTELRYNYNDVVTDKDLICTLKTEIFTYQTFLFTIPDINEERALLTIKNICKLHNFNLVAYRFVK